MGRHLAVVPTTIQLLWLISYFRARADSLRLEQFNVNALLGLRLQGAQNVAVQT